MTAAQRVTLETAKGYHAARVFEYRETGETAMADKHQRVADALRAALGTCGNCAHLRDGLCLTDELDHPSAQSGRPLAITRPDRFGCTGWTAKEGA